MEKSQIVKALECCSKDDCDNCPNNFGNCYANLARYALDLINRQQAEIEGLIAGRKILNKCVSKVKAEAIKEFAERLRKKAFLSKGWQAVAVYDITALVKEMTEVQQ